MHERHHLRCDYRRNRRAVATLEFVMALPLLFVLMICILFEGFWLIGQAEVLITARNDTWKKRFDNASGDPLLFPVLDDPVPLGLYHKAKDYVTEKATTEVDISPAFEAVADPEASHTILAGSWDHRAMPFEKAPHLKLMAIAAAVGTGGNLLDWVSQLTNPVGLVKKFQNFGTGIKSENDAQKTKVGQDDGSTDDDPGTGTPPPPAPDGKTSEQAKQDTEKKREDEILAKKKDYKRLGGRIHMFGPQAGQIVAERGEMKQANDEIGKLQEERATKFREMDAETDADKKKKLQEELAQLQRKIDLTKIRYKRIEQEFLDVSAELDALGIDLWDQLSI
jgi:hypothetical protein